MTDINDIKTIIFWFIYSYKYLILFIFILFIVFYYYLLTKYFKKENLKEKTIEKKEEIIEENELKNKLLELENDINILPREIFYDEILNILKDLTYKNFKDENIYTSTLKELKENYNLEYYYIFKEAYFHQFNENLEDNYDIRKNIIEETKKVL